VDVYDWVTAFHIIAVIAWMAGFIRVQLCRRADSAAHPGLRVGVKAILWVQHGDAPRFVLGEQNCTVEHPNFLY
jgi:hypothetical protein